MSKSERGITLIEIMIAMIILGIGISLAMRTLPDSNKVTTRARNITMATNLVQEKLEQLQRVRHSDPEMTGGAHTDAANPIDDHFRRTWTVQDNVPYDGMKTVSVTVTFPTASADSSVTISSIMSSRL